MNISKHFTIEKISEGVWTTSIIHGGSHICNSGIIDLGKETLIFDTGLCFESAQDLKDTAENLTGKTPSLVVNSHLHDDHFWGNQIFSEAKVITSKENVWINEPKWKQNAERMYNNALGAIEKVRIQLESESDYEREDAKLFTGFFQGIIDTVPYLIFKTPEITFNNHLSLDAERRVEIIEYRNGHSESDCVLHLPDDKIVFTGDLCNIGYHLFFGLGNPINMLKILEQLKELEVEIVVPGHGPVGGSKAFDDMIEYITTLQSLVGDIISEGGTEEDAVTIPVPEKYLGLYGRDFFYYRNLRSMYRIMKSF